MWAHARKLDAIALVADYHTNSDRHKAKKMLSWSHPVTTDEICEAMRRSKHTAYPFAFLEKDILEMRAKNPPREKPVTQSDGTPEPAHPAFIYNDQGERVSYEELRNGKLQKPA